MTLEITIGKKKERRLMKHLKMEHPSVRGNIRMRGNRQINRILKNVPDFEKQAEEFTQLKRLLKRRKK